MRTPFTMPTDAAALASDVPARPSRCTLERAIEEREVRVRYRGVWDLVDREVVGLEAHPTAGAVHASLMASDDVWREAGRRSLRPRLLEAMEEEVAFHRLGWELEGLLPHVRLAWDLGSSGRARRRPHAPVLLELAAADHRLDGAHHVPVDLDDVEDALARLERQGRPALAVLVPSAITDRMLSSRPVLRAVHRLVRVARRHDAVVAAGGVRTYDVLLAVRDLGFIEVAGPICGPEVGGHELRELGPIASTMLG